MILFAYGINMNPGHMTRLCPEHRTVGVARLTSYRLCFPRFSQAHGGAIAGMEPFADSAVWGVLYDIPPGDLPVLNYHEGYDPDGLMIRNQHVLREITVLRLGGSEAVKASAYFPVPDGTSVRPSAGFIQLLIDGALYHGLPRAYIAALEAIRTA